MTNSEKKPLQLLLISIVIWGVSFPVIKYGLRFIAPLEFLWYRFALASIVLVPLAILGWKTTNEYLSIKRAVLLSGLGLAGIGGSLTLLYFGMDLTLASRAVLILSVNPLMTALLSGIIVKKIPANLIKGCLIASIGLTIIIAEPLFSTNTQIATASVRGNLLVVASALIWTVYSIAKKIYFEKQTLKTSPATATALAFLASTAVITPVVYSTYPDILAYPTTLVDPQVVSSLLFLGIVSSILGFITFEAGRKIIGSEKAGRFLFLQPVVGIPLAILWLGEPLTFPFLLGAGIIAAGVFLAEKSTKK